MNKAMVLFQLDDLKYNLQRIDQRWRGTSDKRTPEDIRAALQSIRALKINIEHGLYDQTFNNCVQETDE